MGPRTPMKGRGRMAGATHKAAPRVLRAIFTECAGRCTGRCPERVRSGRTTFVCACRCHLKGGDLFPAPLEAARVQG